MITESERFRESIARIVAASAPPAPEPAPTTPPPAYPEVNDRGEIYIPPIDSEAILAHIEDPAERVKRRADMMKSGTYHHSR